MKEYKKTYEDVYTSERIRKKCKIEDVEFNSDINKIEYIKLFRDTVEDAQKLMFDQWVKVYWLIINFSYRGLVRNTISTTNNFHDGTFTVFCRDFINFNKKLFTHSVYFKKISSYFTDFFPDLHEGNPFESEFKYPFKYMNLDCLLIVYQLPERLDILEIGERDKMTYPEFLDYCINYIMCRNEELGVNDYNMIYASNFPPYIKYENYANNRKFQRKKTRRKRTT